MQAFRIGPICAAAISVLAAVPDCARADEAELLRRIDALTERLKQLEAKTALPPAATSPAGAPTLRDSTAPVPPASAISAAPVAPTGTATAGDYVSKGTFPGSILIPGTRTSLRIGGYADLDIYKDSTGAGGGIFIPQLIPLNGTPAAQRKGNMGMNARQSRLYVRTLTPTSAGDVATYIEGDFYGAGGNELASNSVAFRLRQAYVEWAGWLVGQAPMTITDLPSMVETLDFSGGMGTVGVGRQPQVRYTARWGGGHSELMTALENGQSDVYGTTTTTIGAASGPTSAQTLNKQPDLSMRYAYNDTWGRVALGGIVRRINFNNTGGAPVNGVTGAASTFASLVSVAGKINTFGGDSFQFSLATGAGAGRYILDAVGNTAAALDSNGRLHAIRETGITFGYRHPWSPTLRSNLVYSRITYDYPRPAVALTTPNRFDGFWINLIWNPIPNGLIGLEFNPASIHNAAATNNYGRNNRWQSSFKYSF